MPCVLMQTFEIRDPASAAEPIPRKHKGQSWGQEGMPESAEGMPESAPTNEEGDEFPSTLESPVAGRGKSVTHALV